MVTYADNSSLYTISFNSDTLIASTNPVGYYIDSSFYQIIKWKIPEESLNAKYKTESERLLLDSFYNAEKDYVEQSIFMQSSKSISEHFTNSNGKEFLLWHYEIPILDRKKTAKESDSIINKGVRNQLAMLFVANKHVVMITRSVFDTESLEEKIKMFKNEIANTVRIYNGNINLNVLSNQINYKIKEEPFYINVEELGLQFEVPFWLNVFDTKYDLAGLFPDVNNISNAMVLVMQDKDGVKFEEFCNKILSSNTKYSYSDVRSSRPSFKKYKVLLETPTNTFYCQFVFFETNSKYAWLNFTATKETYEINVKKLDGFVENIKLLSN
mgnify:CR=1 FL=1